MSEPTTPFVEEWLPVEHLEYDLRAQRNLVPTKVHQIMKAFRWSAMGVITVSARSGGVYIVIDGQHRVEAARRLDPQSKVLCHVFRGLNLAQEAALFLTLNNTTKPRVGDKFRVRLTAEDPTALEINKIVESRGWELAQYGDDGLITCVATLERIYRLSLAKEAEPNLVDACLLVVTRAWGSNQYGVWGSLLEGIAALFVEHGSRLDIDRLIETLRDIKKGPEELISEVRHHAEIRRMAVRMAVADIITEKYNRRMKTRKLPDWRKKR